MGPALNQKKRKGNDEDEGRYKFAALVPSPKPIAQIRPKRHAIEDSQAL
jgi:hypothetical protein